MKINITLCPGTMPVGDLVLDYPVEPIRQSIDQGCVEEDVSLHHPHGAVA